jgi:hypothetical protein
MVRGLSDLKTPIKGFNKKDRRIFTASHASFHALYLEPFSLIP